MSFKGRLKILSVEKYSKSCLLYLVLKYWINSKTRSVWILEWHLHVVSSSCNGAEHATHYCERLYGGDVIRRLLCGTRTLFVQRDRRHSLL